MVVVMLDTRTHVAIRVTRIVQMPPDRSGLQRVKFVDRRVVLIIVVYVERDWVHLIHAERWIHVGQRRDRGPHERNGPCIPRVPRNVARRAGLRTVEHRKVVLMRVAEEDGGDRVGREPTHDLEKEIRRLVKRFGACPAGQYVSQDPYALALPLCGKELVRQETEHAT